MPGSAAVELRAIGPLRTRRTWIWATLGLVILAVWAYGPAFRAGYVWDDDLYVTNNPHVQAPDGLRDIWSLYYNEKKEAWLTRTFQYYPFVFTSFWVEYQLFGLDPAISHAINFALHLLNAWLVFHLARRLSIPGAGFVAGVFLLHPMIVESVAWIAERKNVLSGFFFLLSVLAYLRFEDEGGVRVRTRWYSLSFLLFLAALLSKTVTATLPCVLVLALYWKHRRLSGRDLARLLPFFGTGALLGWFSAFLERTAVGANTAEFGQTAFERWFLIAPRALCFYAAKLVWPYPITFNYPRWELHADDALAYVYVAGIAAVFLGLFLLRRRIGIGPLLLVLGSAVTLAPALGFVPVFPHRYSWVADHFAYLGTLGFLGLIAVAGTRLIRFAAPDPFRQPVALACGTLLLVACALRSHVEARSYHDKKTLWTDTLAENPDSWIAMVSLGIELMSEEPRTAAQEDAALALFRRAESYPLGRGQGLTNQGLWFQARQRWEEAADAFRRALALEPGRAKPRVYLAECRWKQAMAAKRSRNDAQALQAALDGLSEIGNDARLSQLVAWVRATSIDASLRNGSEARAMAERLVAQEPANPGYLDTLAAACAESGDYTSAVKYAGAAADAARASGHVDQVPVIAGRLALYRDARPCRD